MLLNFQSLKYFSNWMPLFRQTKALGNQFFNEKFVNRLSTKRIIPFLFFWERSSRDNAKMKSAYDFWHGFEVLNLSFSSINRADFFFLQLSRFTLLSLPSLPFLWTTTNGGLTEKKSRSFDFTRSRTHEILRDLFTCKFITHCFRWVYVSVSVVRLRVAEFFIFVSITVDFFFTLLSCKYE